MVKHLNQTKAKKLLGPLATVFTLKCWTFGTWRYDHCKLTYLSCVPMWLPLVEGD